MFVFFLSEKNHRGVQMTVGGGDEVEYGFFVVLVSGF